MTLNGSSPNLTTESAITVVATSSPNLSQLSFNESAVISFKAGLADQEFSGISERDIANQIVTQYKVYYLTTSGTWDLADANQDEDHASHLLAMAMGGGSQSDGMMLQGFAGLEGHGFNIGQPLYLSNTAGSLTNTVPSSGWARIAGYAVNDDCIYFDPDKTFVTIN
tara:strand:+ start:334 stop:834 length:501 start_codon:yes stop_codon:yes gene_type:complete